MNLSRRATLLSLAVAGATAGPVMADTWPSRTINFVVPFPAGGNVDLSARIVAARSAASPRSAFGGGEATAMAIEAA